MKHMNFQYTYAKTCENLRASDAKAAAALAEKCCRHDNIRLSYPADPGEADYYCLLWGEPVPQMHPAGAGGLHLIAALAVVSYDEETAECIAFTDPEARKCGYFTHLLELALKEYGGTDLLFPVSGACEDTMAALDAMEAELDHAEHTMLYEASDFHQSADCAGAQVLKPLSLPEDPEEEFFFEDPDNHGHCILTIVADDCVCLHHVEVAEAFRGQGCGTRMIRSLLARLNISGIPRVMLQVSGDNDAAISVYKKTGFRIIETLSYYQY